MTEKTVPLEVLVQSATEQEALRQAAADAASQIAADIEAEKMRQAAAEAVRVAADVEAKQKVEAAAEAARQTAAEVARQAVAAAEVARQAEAEARRKVEAAAEAARAVEADAQRKAAVKIEQKLEALAKVSFRNQVLTRVRRSVTIIWARILGIIGVLLSGASLLDAPGLQENVVALLNPKYVPLYLIAIAVITELARRRTLNKPVIVEVPAPPVETPPSEVPVYLYPNSEH